MPRDLFNTAIFVNRAQLQVSARFATPFHTRDNASLLN